MATEVTGESKKRDVFFANGIDDSDGASGRTEQTNDRASGAAELALKGRDRFGRRAEVLFVEVLENIHAFAFAPSAGCFLKITQRSCG